MKRLLKRRPAFVSLALAAAACSGPASREASSVLGATAPAPSRQAVLEGISGTRPSFARPSNDRGRLDRSRVLTGMSLAFKPSASQRAGAKASLASLEAPSSPSYHHWLRPNDVASVVGASPSVIARATGWLSDQGFVVHGASPTKTRIFFSGTAGQFEDAFATELHEYDVRGETQFAPATDPKVPGDLAPSVLGLRGAHSLPRARPGRQAAPRGNRLSLEEGNGEYLLVLAPLDFATQYDLNPLYAQGLDGTGTSIAVVGTTDFHDADIAYFRTNQLLSSTLPLRTLVPMSGTSTFEPYGNFGETVLDLEWSGGVAKGASIDYVYVGNNQTYGPFDAIAYAIEQGKDQIITTSYGSCEPDFETSSYTPADAIYLEWMGDAAAMEGITLVSAAGDWGAEDCFGDTDQMSAQTSQGLSVDMPGSIPSVVSVGGTMLDWGGAVPNPLLTEANVSVAPFSTYWTCDQGTPVACTPRGYIPETAWNEAAYYYESTGYLWGAGGGGQSSVFPRPYWQTGVAPSGGRSTPDVSLSASASQVGYVIASSWSASDGSDQSPYEEQWLTQGGTSAAAPSFAGILAIVNQAVAKTNPTLPLGLGNANPTLYALQAATANSSAPAFHDIVTGTTDVPCASGSPGCGATGEAGFAAGAGYDLATGLGSIDGAELVSAWTALAPTSVALVASPTSSAEGATVTLTATVGSHASANALGGSVTFYMTTTSDAGLNDLAVVATAPVLSQTSGGSEGGTASVHAVPPAGITGSTTVVAFYGGDDSYLASWSKPSTLTTSFTISLAPGNVTLAPGAMTTFIASGGTPPFVWETSEQLFCETPPCSGIESVGPAKAAFIAGGTSVFVQAIDAHGAAARAFVTVSGTPIDGGSLPPAWDGGAPSSGFDSGIGGMDAGTQDEAGSFDGGSKGQEAGPLFALDAGSGEGHGDSASSSGCSASGHEARGFDALLVLLGLGLMRGSRRRGARVPPRLEG